MNTKRRFGWSVGRIERKGVHLRRGERLGGNGMAREAKKKRDEQDEEEETQAIHAIPRVRL